MIADDKTGYHEYMRMKGCEGALPPQVCRDLNIDDLLDELDDTTSCVGRQYLYHTFCTDRVSEVVRHEEFVRSLSADTVRREEIVRLLGTLSHSDAYSITGLLAEKGYRYSSRYLLLLQVCRWLPLCAVLWMIFIPSSIVPFVCLLVAYIVNGVLHFREKNKLTGYFFSVPQLRKLLKLAIRLAKDPGLDAIGGREVKPLSAGLGNLQKKLGLFRFGIGLESEAAMLFYLFTELVNIFFLFSTLNIVYSFIAIQDRKPDIEKAFCLVGRLDMLCSLSLLRERLPYWCSPGTPSGVKLHVEEVYHPLIENCVPNDLTLTRRSILITGSNMSGKTSFIRTIGINLLAAKTLNTCFAKNFTIDCRLGLYSVIHTEDDLLEGKSYFFEEAERVKDSLERGAEGGYLFIFDELFKGTNGVERVAINASVFTDLATKGNLILASTHDLRLAELLESEYELYHFCETISNQKLSFDYLLKPGVVKEGNAIKLLQLCGYPSEIIRSSTSLVSRLTS